MGVSTLLPLIPASGRSSTHQQLADLEQRIVTLGAEKVGMWSVHCVTYHATSVLTNATLTQNRTLHVLQSSEDLDSCYAISGSGVCIAGDRDLASIMTQLGTFYTQRKAITVEAKGPRYQLGDFLIKPGVVSMGPNAHSNVLEVEYLPCCVATQCWGLVNQMLVQIMDQSSLRRQLPAGHMEGTIYNRSHTMLQFLDVFNGIWSGPR